MNQKAPEVLDVIKPAFRRSARKALLKARFNAIGEEQDWLKSLEVINVDEAGRTAEIVTRDVVIPVPRTPPESKPSDQDTDWISVSESIDLNYILDKLPLIRCTNSLSHNFVETDVGKAKRQARTIPPFSPQSVPQDGPRSARCGCHCPALRTCECGACICGSFPCNLFRNALPTCLACILAGHQICGELHESNRQYLTPEEQDQQSVRDQELARKMQFEEDAPMEVEPEDGLEKTDRRR